MEIFEALAFAVVASIYVQNQTLLLAETEKEFKPFDILARNLRV